MFWLNYCERKTLFQLKKEAEQTGYGVSRTGPNICSVLSIIVQYKLCSKNYLQEAIWSSQKYQPSFKEHEELSIMTSGLPMLTILTLMGYGDEATQEVFEWVSSVPEMVRAGSQVTRFLNDLSSYKVYILTVTILTSLA